MIVKNKKQSRVTFCVVDNSLEKIVLNGVSLEVANNYLEKHPYMDLCIQIKTYGTEEPY